MDGKSKEKSPKKEGNISNFLQWLGFKGSPNDKSGDKGSGKKLRSPKVRRRLSVMPGKISLDEEKKLDGHAGEGKTDKTIKKTFGFSKKGIIKSFASRSHVGYVPFNSGKVNQDRYTEHPSFMGKANKSLYGVFDGHGVYGHDVSQYLIDTLPKMIAKEKNLDKDFKTKITNIFVACNENLKKSGIDTACSGTTAVVCYIVGTRILTCNSGDSRAVIALRSPDGKLVAKPLSIDQKPELESEKKRILKEGGRVQACRDLDGNPVGPLRVWLRYQDIPGLAMTRSFGDSLAASVGVSCKPDILEHDIKEGKDQFFILASDGVWEFISNQEAVDIVAKCKSPEEAAEALVAESTKRWQEEEDVIDDITATVVYLKGSKYPLGPSKKK